MTTTAFARPTKKYEITCGNDDNGRPIFSLLVKRTYSIVDNGTAVRTAESADLLKIDEYYDNGNPLTASVKFESELAAFKPATDVVVIGKAYAPDGVPCAQTDVMVTVGPYWKKISVFGDRKCRHRLWCDPEISEPEPFTEMELRYERAYGGSDLKSNPQIPFLYPRNTIGRGVAMKNIPDIIDDLPLPNLEDPEDKLTPDRIILEKPEHWSEQPLPQGFGWFPRTCYPRSCFAGTVPGAIDIRTITREEQLGYVPKNHLVLARQFRLPVFDVRFNNGASPGLAVPYLSGRETIRLVNMTPAGLLQFTLPDDRPCMTLDIGLGENSLEPVMHTVCVRVENMEVDIVWRGALEYPGHAWLPEMNKIHAEVFDQ